MKECTAGRHWEGEGSGSSCAVLQVRWRCTNLQQQACPKLQPHKKAVDKRSGRRRRNLVQAATLQQQVTSWQATPLACIQRGVAP